MTLAWDPTNRPRTPIAPKMNIGRNTINENTICFDWKGKCTVLSKAGSFTICKLDLEMSDHDYKLNRKVSTWCAYILRAPRCQDLFGKVHRAETRRKFEYNPADERHGIEVKLGLI
jgi:hypothetical protein